MIVGAAGAPITIESACVSLRAGVPESSARTVKGYVPAVVGVPVIAPVALERARPGGKAPAASDQAYGVFHLTRAPSASTPARQFLRAGSRS